MSMSYASPSTNSNGPSGATVGGGLMERRNQSRGNADWVSMPIERRCVRGVGRECGVCVGVCMVVVSGGGWREDVYVSVGV
jgi:hypothetical protein